MDKFLDFITNNYVWFLTISIILLFALIGFIVDNRRSKNDIFKKQEEEIEELNLENFELQEGKSLSELMNTSKNINTETKQVELTDGDILSNDNSDILNKNI